MEGGRACYYSDCCDLYDSLLNTRSGIDMLPFKKGLMLFAARELRLLVCQFDLVACSSCS